MKHSRVFFKNVKVGQIFCLAERPAKQKEDWDVKIWPKQSDNVKSGFVNSESVRGGFQVYIDPDRLVWVKPELDN